MTLWELNQHFCAVAAYQEAKEKLLNMRETILGASQIDGIPKQGYRSDKLELLAISLDLQEKEVARLKAAAKENEEEIISFVDSIPDNHTKMIISLRYISCCSWNEVAAIIGGGNTPDSVKMVCYRYLKRAQL